MRFAYFTAFSLSTAMLPAFAEPSSIQNATQQAVDTRQQQQQNILNAEIQSQQVKTPTVRLESEKVHALGDAARDNLSLISAINQIKYFYTY